MKDRMTSINCTPNYSIMAGIEDFLTSLHIVSFFLIAFGRFPFIRISSTGFICLQCRSNVYFMIKRELCIYAEPSLLLLFSKLSINSKK